MTQTETMGATQAKPKRERGQGRIWIRFPENSNIFWIQFYDSRGRQVRESSHSENRRAAQDLLTKRIGEVNKGLDQDVRVLRYEDIRSSYLRKRLTGEDKSLPRRVDGSLILGEDALPVVDSINRLDAFFAGCKVKSVRVGLLDQFVAKLKEQGYANGSINRSLSSLRAMFSLAKETGTVHEMPARWPMLKEAKPRKGFFELPEYRALLAALPDDLKPLLAIGYWTGMRVSEIRGLLWDQIDFLNGLILLDDSKNGEGRCAPMARELAAILQARHATRPKGFPYVCYRIDRNGRVRKVASFDECWRNACVKLGLGTWITATDAATGEVLYNKPRGPRSKPKPKMVYEGRLFHDLRRTGVRNLVRAGVPQSVAMDISGHKTISVFKRYNITDTRDVIAAGKKLQDFISAQESFGAVSGQLGDFKEARKELKN